jgi:flagellar protein FlgJ
MPIPLRTPARSFSLTGAPPALTRTVPNTSLKPPATPDEEKTRAEALQAAQDFENIFLTHLLKTMRSAVPKVGFLQQTFASNTYQQMFDEELSSQLAHGKGLGLSEMLYREFMRRESRLATE